ncbi:PrsW family intramembrane metalloprotease [Halospeciosus flavus]
MVAAGEAEVLIRDGAFRVADTRKGQAALAELRDAVTAYNDYLMRQEPDQAAAFPVVVDLRYVSQTEVVRVGAPGGGGPTTTTPADRTTEPGGTATPTTTPSGDGDGAGSGFGGFPSLPGGAFGGTQSGTPGELTPPFPLGSLVLAFAFLLPMNVVIQAYGSTVIGERINRRGEPLLVAPVSPADIVVGKTLPYFLGAAVVTAVIAAAVGGGVVTVAAVLPIAALFLATTFVGALLARSYKELTFVTVAVSVGLTAYAFVPAVFTEVHPIAAISPLSLVVQDLQGQPVGAGEFVFSTLPATLAAAVCFALGIGIYREEDLFTQRPIPAKLGDALAAPLSRPRDVALWTVLFIPFVLVAELFTLALLFVLPTSISVPVLLVAIALVEEVAKSIHVRAAFARGVFERSTRTGLLVGALAGAGFFVGEKLLLVVQLVGLPELVLGRATLATVGAAGMPLWMLVAPLALHVGTAALSAVGASRDETSYLVALAGAVVVHVAYNLTVVTSVA